MDLSTKQCSGKPAGAPSDLLAFDVETGQGGNDPTSTDLELRVRRLLRQGDSNGAATCVLEELGPGVLGHLSAMLLRDDANDAFSYFQQDVWRGLPGFRWECPLHAWSNCLARHAAARIGRDAYRRRRQPLAPSIAARLVTSPVPILDVGRDRELTKLNHELTPHERLLLALRVDRDLPWSEVSALLSADGEAVSSSALRKRFERLKGKLVTLARTHGLQE